MALYDLIYRGVVFPRLDRKRGYGLLRRIEAFSGLLSLPAERLAEVRAERLRAAMIHAAETSPFWGERFRAAGVHPSSVRSAEDLRALPLLEKDDVRRHGEAMLSRAILPEQRRADLTGGSTAAPLPFHRDLECLADREACSWAVYRWMGRSPFDRWALVWGALRDLDVARRRRADLRSRLLNRVITLPGNRMDEAAMTEFVGRMRRFRPRFLHGYAQGIALLARHVRDRKLSPPPLAGASITAEAISAAEKQMIGEVFDCPVFNLYATREFGILAAECSAHAGMHINPLNAVVEFVQPDGTPAPPGQPGQVVVTDLLNRAMPLIRYRIGDVGIPRQGPCPCGHDLPTMEVAAGRETDFIVTPDGRFIAGAAITLISSPGIARLQFVQREPGALIVRYKPTPSFHPGTLGELEQQLAQTFGAGFAYQFEEVDEIPLTPSGKFVYVSSEVSRRRLGRAGDA